MNWKGRKPNIKYFSHGYINYLKLDGELYFQLRIYADDGYDWIKNKEMKVPSENFVIQIQKCSTLIEVMEIIDEHLNVKVIQN